MKLVIIAGGKGTRLGFKEIPKPMVKFNGVPILEHQINLAKKYKINEVYILSGHLSKVIVDYFGDGSKFGVNIKHIIEDKPLNTAGALRQLELELIDRFMVFYGDTIMDIDLASFIKFDSEKKNSIGSIIIHPNDHPFDSDLLEIDNDEKVSSFYSKPHKNNKFYTNLVNAALYILSPSIFNYIPKDVASDFGKDIFPKVILKENLYGYKTTEYIKDMGTPDRFKKVEQDIVSGKVLNLNRERKQKAIFLDRDGVINKEVNNLTKVEDFELIERVSESIKLINRSEYLAIVVTNQPVIAKGFITSIQLDLIHKKMDTILGDKGAYIDDLFYCPHHQDSGFEGEVKKLKINCNCRKPNSGMLIEAAKKYNIDLDKSWIIGDRYADVKAGSNVDVSTILLKTGHAGNDKDKYFDLNPDKEFKNLYDAVNYII